MHPEIEKLIRTRRALLEAIAGLSEDVMANTPMEGYWSAKDLLAHIASWEKTVISPLHELIRGKDYSPLVVSDEESFNAEQVNQSREKSLSEILAEMEEVRQALIEACNQLTEEQFNLVRPAPWGGEDTIARQIGGLAWHEDLHTQTILQWRKANLK